MRPFLYTRQTALFEIVTEGATFWGGGRAWTWRAGELCWNDYLSNQPISVEFPALAVRTEMAELNLAAIPKFYRRRHGYRSVPRLGYRPTWCELALQLGSVCWKLPVESWAGSHRQKPERRESDSRGAYLLQPIPTYPTLPD
ncbi:hypothetical protein TWF569_009544 [Orbilia oligospora]|nr:hypothetical protein TWF569_009544 [Orbilia oligospora]